MTRIKRILILLIAALPIPGVAMAAQFSKVAPAIEKSVAHSSFLDALMNEELSDSYYEVLERMAIESLEDLLLPENRYVLETLVSRWEKETNDMIILAGGVTSELPTER